MTAHLENNDNIKGKPETGRHLFRPRTFSALIQCSTKLSFFFLQFNPSSPFFPNLYSSEIYSTPHLHTSPSSSSSCQVKSDMECVEAKALKTSFRPEMVVKSNPQAFLDDVLCGNGPSGVSGDDFFVDDLLDFSNGDVEEGFVEEDEEEEEEEKDCVSVCSQEHGENNNFKSDAFPVQDDLGSVPASELCVPTDDLADLEWLSHFVEDSFSEFSLPCPPGNVAMKPESQSENMCESEAGSVSLKPPCFLTPVPSRARSKRTRTGGRVWSFGSRSLSESSSTSSTSSSSSSSSSTSCLIFPNAGQSMELFCYLGKPPPSKKQKKRGATETGVTQPQRRCSHCHVQKTPQWRTGPLGPKTLCNACGVRYKSGRLLPEYRPACSPTFSGDIHSNNHRKVLEMRRKKETTTACLETGLAPAVKSF